MNKQEAIEKIKNIETLNIKDRIADKGVDMVIKNQVLDIISQIDEPQKVVVPKFVAEWLEYCKGAYRDLQMVLSRLDHDTIARAWLDGYEIEQEKLYTVELLNPNIIGNEHTVLVKNGFKKIVMIRVYGDNWRTAKGYHLTEAEIKKDFEWAWDAGFAKEVE